MPRAPVVLICIAVLGLGAGLAWAQGGTPNLESATLWEGLETQLRGEARFFEGSGNETVAVTLQGAVDEGLDAEVSYFTMDTQGTDPINSVVRRSEMDLVTVALKWLLSDRSTKIALQPGLEMPLSAPTGTNASTSASAPQRRVIPTLSLPMQWGDPEGLLLILEPKAAWFEDNIPNSLGGTTAGFGDVIAVGGGVVYGMGTFSLMGDATILLSGDNTMDEVTNTPTDDLVWSAGASWVAGGRYDLTLSAFATNGFGPTTATSLLATPDQSIGTGLCVSGEF